MQIADVDGQLRQRTEILCDLSVALTGAQPKRYASWYKLSCNGGPAFGWFRVNGDRAWKYPKRCIIFSFPPLQGHVQDMRLCDATDGQGGSPSRNLVVEEHDAVNFAAAVQAVVRGFLESAGR